jgi:Flp pilus assembly pilin Flp
MNLKAQLMKWRGRECEGQNMVEYALMIGLISGVAVASLYLAGSEIVVIWEALGSMLNSAAAAL